MAPETWLSRQRFCELSGWTIRWLSAQVLQGNVRTRDTDRKLANGRLDVEFAASSLPPKARTALEATQQDKNPAQRELGLFGPTAVTAARRVALPAKGTKQMTDRLNILQPILYYKADPGRYAALRLADGRPVTSLTDMVTLRAETLAQLGTPVSVATLWRMLKRHTEGGDTALARKPRQDANQSAWFAEHRDAATLVASVYLGDGFLPGSSVRAAYDSLVQQRELLGLVKADLPSYDTVRRFLQSDALPTPLVTLARDGRKKFNDLHMPYVSRGYTEAAGTIWLSDHMIADVEVLNDCFFGPGDPPAGAPMRMRLTALLDYRSRALLEHVWCVEGSSVSLAAAMVRGVRKHGLPDLFYCDNGKDYVKFAKGAAPGYLVADQRDEWWSKELDSNAGMLARLGVRVNHCIAHHPQSKHVERFFGTLHEQFCRLWWTYTGGTPSRRPDSTTALMMLHRKLIRHGEVHRSMTPPATLFMQLFDRWVDQYHATPHSGKGMDGRSPAEVLEQERSPNLRPAPPVDQLLTASMEHDTRLVRRNAIELFAHRYVPADAQSSVVLFAHDGKQVRIAYDRLDPEWIAVMDDSGFLLCMLRIEQLLAFAPDDKGTQAQIAASMQSRNALARQTREQLQAISRGARQIGVRKPIEMLAAQSTGVPAGVDPKRISSRPVKPSQRNKVATKTIAAPRYAANLADKFLEGI